MNAKSEKNKGGRPRKLQDPRLRGMFLVALASGASRRMTCKAFGIDQHTLTRECKADPEFKIELENARKRGKFSALYKITRSKDWRAAAWYLERVYPQQFAKRQPDVITREQLNSALASVVALLFAGNVPRNESEALAKIQGQLVDAPSTDPAA